MHINSPDGVIIRVHDREVRLDFPPDCALFIGRNAPLVIDESVLIVGVENFENLKFSLKERTLFPQTQQIVFAERGPVLKKFLADVTNPYLHFGDIDLPGISIYQTEYAPITKERGSFFIPANVENLLEKGSPELHRNHMDKFGTLQGINADIEMLIALIKSKKKRLAQEFFLYTD